MTNNNHQRQLTALHWLANGIGVVCVCVIVLATYNAHRSSQRKCDTLELQRRSDLSLLARAEDVRTQRDQAAKQHRALNDQLAELKSRMPSSPNEAEFLAQVSAAAERSSVRLRNFRPGQVTSNGAISNCDVQLSLVGPFASICTLLDSLRGVPRYLSIARLALTGPQQAGDPCVADMTISLSFAPPQSKRP